MKNVTPIEEPEPETPSITNNGGELWIEVNLSEQYLTVWQGDTVVNSTYVSTFNPISTFAWIGLRLGS